MRIKRNGWLDRMGRRLADKLPGWMPFTTPWRYIGEDSSLQSFWTSVYYKRKVFGFLFLKTEKWQTSLWRAFVK